MEKRNEILELTLGFALDIIEFTKILEAKKKFVIARQLLKSGTSVGANSREAQNAESKADFVHKLKIAAKEADETEYWLLLCEKAPSYESHGILLDKIKPIQRILTKTISSSKKNMQLLHHATISSKSLMS